MKNHLLDLFENNKLDDIMSEFSVDEVASQLDFKNAIKLAWRMLFDDYDAYQQSEFGVNLLFALKKFKFDDWCNDWRYEALLGVACDNTYLYDERFYAFKRAYENAKKLGEGNHPGLLIALARCCHTPDTSLISYDDALKFVLRAIEDKVYLDGAWALSGIYSSLGNKECHQKWKQLAQKLESENGELSPHFYPRFLWDEEISPKK